MGNETDKKPHVFGVIDDDMPPMDNALYKCPECGGEFEVDISCSCSKVRCPNCNEIVWL